MLQILHWTVEVDWCTGSVTITKWYKICHHSIWRELNLAVTNSSYAYSRTWFTYYCIVYNIVIEYIQLCYISNAVMCPSSVHINHLLMLISTTSQKISTIVFKTCINDGESADMESEALRRVHLWVKWDKNAKPCKRSIRTRRKQIHVITFWQMIRLQHAAVLLEYILCQNFQWKKSRFTMRYIWIISTIMTPGFPRIYWSTCI